MFYFKTLKKELKSGVEPVAKDEAHRKWRNDWLAEVTKARDQDFREQIKNDRVHACEKHLKPEDIEICKYRIIFCQKL